MQSRQFPGDGQQWLSIQNKRVKQTISVHRAATTSSSLEMRFLLHVLPDTSVFLYLFCVFCENSPALNKSARRSMESRGVKQHVPEQALRAQINKRSNLLTCTCAVNELSKWARALLTNESKNEVTSIDKSMTAHPFGERRLVCQAKVRRNIDSLFVAAGHHSRKVLGARQKKSRRYFYECPCLWSSTRCGSCGLTVEHHKLKIYIYIYIYIYICPVQFVFLPCVFHNYWMSKPWSPDVLMPSCP